MILWDFEFQHIIQVKRSHLEILKQMSIDIAIPAENKVLSNIDPKN